MATKIMTICQKYKMNRSYFSTMKHREAILKITYDKWLYNFKLYYTFARVVYYLIPKASPAVSFSLHNPTEVIARYPLILRFIHAVLQFLTFVSKISDFSFLENAIFYEKNCFCSILSTYAFNPPPPLLPYYHNPAWISISTTFILSIIVYSRAPRDY